MLETVENGPMNVLYELCEVAVCQHISRNLFSLDINMASCFVGTWKFVVGDDWNFV